MIDKLYYVLGIVSIAIGGGVLVGVGLAKLSIYINSKGDL